MPSRSRPVPPKTGQSGLQWAHATQSGYMSVKHAAAWADVSPRTIKRWIHAGLPTHQAGPRAKVLINPIEVEAFLTKKQAPAVDLNALVDEVLQGLIK